MLAQLRPQFILWVLRNINFSKEKYAPPKGGGFKPKARYRSLLKTPRMGLSMPLHLML
jgi:hypothetical protein